MKQQIITIAQQKGGVGKTTLTAHLAVALSQRNLRVAVIDIDPQGSITQWYALRENRFGSDYTGFTFENVAGWRISSAIARLKYTHDIILIDTPPHAEMEIKNAVRASTCVLIPVQPSPTDLWATQATIDIADAEEIPAYTILNRCPSNSKLAKFCAQELPRLITPVLGNRVAYVNCMVDGRTVTETEPASAAAKEVKELVKHLIGILSEDETINSKEEATA